MGTEATPRLKYAHVEREHRFLLDGPVDLTEATRTLSIHDRYVRRTRLRLRRVDEQVAATVFKLGQKIRFDANDPTSLAHTTMYLTPPEYDLLAALPADTLTKTRAVIPMDGGLTLAVDTFHGPLTGLVMAEIDLGAHGTPPDTIPAFLGADVSGDGAFTGHALARLDADGLADLLHRFRPAT